jgi:3-oxoacyl-[acyl-carrier-protein] synthase II
MQLALDNAGVKPSEVDLISAHGTGTKANDVTETRAVRDVYGAAPPRTVSLKSMLGHSMGAASALASIACALAIVNEFIPPTINHVRTDPECLVDCVPNQAVDAQLRIVQNNGMAFGGNNAVVILAKYQERVS